MSYAFATVEEYRARQLKEPTEGELALAASLLEDAGLILRRYVEVEGEDTEQADLLKMVSCNMVKRAINAADADAFGMSEQTVKADIYSVTAKWSNPNGDLYITSGEKTLLGITSSYVESVRPVIDPVEVQHANLWRNG